MSSLVNKREKRQEKKLNNSRNFSGYINNINKNQKVTNINRIKFGYTAFIGAQYCDDMTK